MQVQNYDIRRKSWQCATLLHYRWIWVFRTLISFKAKMSNSCQKSFSVDPSKTIVQVIQDIGMHSTFLDCERYTSQINSNFTLLFSNPLSQWENRQEEI